MDLTDTSKGRIPITMTFRGLRPDQLEFLRTGKAGEYQLHDLEFLSESDEPLESVKRGGRHVLVGPVADPVRLRYEIEPGGPGRHGLQGHAGADFAVFDGRAYVYPVGAMELSDVRIRFETPERWTVAAPFAREGQWRRVSRPGGRATRQLIDSCVGAGTFDEVSRRHGDTTLRVFSFSAWNDDHKAALADKTDRLFRYFHEKLGYDPGGDLVVVWVPKSGRSQVFGGSHAASICFEHPVDRPRNWQLLAHRLGHGMNKYDATGMVIRDRRDHWFKEGWASFVEVTSTHAAGIAPDQAYWNVLYARHQRTRRHNPDWDIALATEPSAPSAAIEYLHYTKAPLVAKMLDGWLVQRTGKSLQGFMHELWARHGRFRGAVALREELEAFAGVPLDEFWALFVDQPGHLVPMWDEAVTQRVKDAALVPPAGAVGGVPVSGDYLYHLAASGRFHRFADVARFVEEEVARRALLLRRGVALIPPPVREHVAGLQPQVRLAIASAEREYPLHRTPRPDPRPATPAEPLVLDPDSDDGRAFGRLLALETTYESQLGDTGVESVTATARTKRQPPGERLAFTPSETVRVTTRWSQPPGSATFELVSGPRVLASSRAVLPVSWTRTTRDYKPEIRSKTDSVIRVLAYTGGRLLVGRGFWQRAKSPKRRAKSPASKRPR